MPKIIPPRKPTEEEQKVIDARKPKPHNLSFAEETVTTRRHFAKGACVCVVCDDEEFEELQAAGGKECKAADVTKYLKSVEDARAKAAAEAEKAAENRAKQADADAAK